MNGTREDTLLQHLGAFASGVDTETVPPEVLKQAKLCILDTLGCIIAGSLLPDGRAFLATEKAMHRGPAEAAVLATDIRLSVEAAARMNGYHGDILELNDLIGGHASIANVAAALATGEAWGLTGRQTLRSLIAGIEVTARINMGYRHSHGGKDTKPSRDCGIATPGIPNTIGASASAGLALGLNATGLTAAMGIAGTMAGWCPTETLSGRGGTIKPIMFGGLPSSVGIQAAQYARHGVTGPLQLLESDVGFFATVAFGYDPDIVRGSMGWALAEPRRKWHACCGYNHAAIDGLSSLLRDRGPELFRDATIEVGLIDYAAEIMDTDTLPVGVNSARFHAKYCLALALQGHDLIVPEHCLDYEEYLADPNVTDAIARISVHADASLDHYSKCNLRVVGPEGPRAELHVPASKGYPGNPMTEDDVRAKFERLTSRVFPKPDVLIDRLMKLENEQEIGFIAKEIGNAAGLN